MKNTFENRGTGYVEGHPLFGEEFFKDPIRTSRWNGFLKSIRRNDEIAFEEVGNVIQEKMRGYWEIVKKRIADGLLQRKLVPLGCLRD